MSEFKSLNESFDFHVDPKHYGFQWEEAMYIFVQYHAIKDEYDGRVVSSIESFTAEPWLVSSIVTHGNWMIVSKEMMAAAQDHAEKSFAKSGQVNETIMSAIAPFINS
jgi:hypothetical protein